MTLNFPQLLSPGPERLAWLVEAADSDTLRAEKSSHFPRSWGGGGERAKRMKREFRINESVV